MNPDTYFNRMRETSYLVDDVIFKTLETLKQQNCEMYEVVATLPKKRRGVPKIRAHLAREAYLSCNEEENNNWVPLAAAVELELNAMYYKNQVFDSKAGCYIGDKNRTIGNWIADSYSRDLAEQVLQEAYEDSRLIELLRESNKVCSEGFWIDLFQNTYSLTKALSFEKQIALCDKRMYKMNAAFYERIGKMGSILAKASDEQMIVLGEFGKYFGIGQQIMNDICDFVPPRLNTGTTEKTSGDAYRDIKTGKMTYPVIWLLHNGEVYDRRLLEKILERGEDTKLHELEDLTRSLVSSGAMDFAIHSAKECRNKARSSLRKAFSKGERDYLSSMCKIFDSNRYYKELTRLKNHSQKPL